MAVYKDCDSCPGKVIVGVFHPIKVDKLDAEGNTVLGMDGKPEKVTLRLPAHAVPPSKFDPTGLSPAPCRHGLAEHPDPDVMLSPHARQAVSWVRAKYLTLGKKGNLPMPGCPVCFGEPMPEDALLAADGTPVGETMMEQLIRLGAT